MATNSYSAVTQYARLQRAAFRPHEVFIKQPRKQVLMNVSHYLSGPDRGGFPMHPVLFHGLLGRHMGQGQALAARLVGIGQIVVVQSLFNLYRQRVLTFDTIVVVGVHGPQKYAQAIQRGRLVFTGKMVGTAYQVVRLLQQTAETMFTGNSGSICAGSSNSENSCDLADIRKCMFYKKFVQYLRDISRDILQPPTALRQSAHSSGTNGAFVKTRVSEQHSPTIARQRLLR